MEKFLLEDVIVKEFIESDEHDNNGDTILYFVVEKDNKNYAIKFCDFILEDKDTYMELIFDSSAYHISSDKNIGEKIDEKDLPFDLEKVSTDIIKKFIDEARKVLSSQLPLLKERGS